MAYVIKDFSGRFFVRHGYPFTADLADAYWFPDWRDATSTLRAIVPATYLRPGETLQTCAQRLGYEVISGPE